MKYLLVVGLALAGGAWAGTDSSQGQDLAGLRSERRFAEALQVAEALTDPALRAREILETRYYAGDLAGALRAALEGLTHAPADRMLLWRGTRLAIDLGAADLAHSLARRLHEEVAAARPTEGPSEGTWEWTTEADGYLEEARQLAQDRGQQGRALTRSRWTLGLALLVLLAGFGIRPRA